jgi:hypothetical protein
MTFIFNQHAYIISTGMLHLWILLCFIELVCWAFIARYWYLRKHPKLAEDPPWPKSPLSVGMRNHLDEREKVININPLGDEELCFARIEIERLRKCR